MYCQTCGEAYNAGDKYCNSCGQNLESLESVDSDNTPAEDRIVEDSPDENNAVYIEPGFSLKENHESVARLRKEIVYGKLKLGLKVGLFVFVIMLGMWIYFESGFTMLGLRVSIQFGVVPILISIPFFLRELMDRPWEGTVTKTKTKVSYESNADDDAERNPRKRTSYIVKVKVGSLRTKKLSFSEWQALNYYRSGSRVKHHKNYPYPEKFDKNEDDGLRCIHCFAENEKASDYCTRCNLVLMK